MSPVTKPVWLLDVNALIALMDSSHIHHDPIHDWFAKHARQGWATCALTENGAVRVMSQTAYPGGARTPLQVIRNLRMFKQLHRAVHTFLPDDVSLTEASLFDPAHFARAAHITDAYLLGLAWKHNLRLVTFDRDLPWQAIRGGSSNLVERPA